MSFHLRLAPILSVIFLCSSAMEPSVLAAPSDREAAVRFKEGARHYREGAFQKALESFLASLELSSRPPTILNIAQCYRQLKQAENAIRYYRLYLAEYEKQNAGESSPHRQEVEEHIAKLGAELARTRPPEPSEGTLTVRSEPAGASILVDGAPLGPAPIVGHKLAAGQHRVAASLGGHTEAIQQVTLAAGQAVEVVLRLSPVAAATPTPPKRRRIWTWVVGAAAVAVGAAGLGVGLSAHLDYDEFRELVTTTPEPPSPREEELRDSIPSRAKASYALYGVAGALAVTSVVLFFVEGRSPAPKESSSSALSVQPVAGSTWGLSLRGAF